MPGLQIGAGAVVRSCTILGNTAGVAIAGGSLTAEIVHCNLRKPTSGGSGSSISPAIINSVSIPLNVELESSVTD